MPDPVIKVIKPADSLTLVSRERAKLAAKIVGDERNEEIEDAIAAAQNTLEDDLHRMIGERILSLTYRSWTGSIELPFDVNEVKSVESDGESVPYSLIGRHLVADTQAPVTVTVSCGWSAKQLPPVLKSAMLLIITGLLENPSSQTTVKLHDNPAYEALVSLWRLRVSI